MRKVAPKELDDKFFDLQAILMELQLETVADAVDSARLLARKILAVRRMTAKEKSK